MVNLLIIRPTTPTTLFTFIVTSSPICIISTSWTLYWFVSVRNFFIIIVIIPRICILITIFWITDVPKIIVIACTIIVWIIFLETIVAFFAGS